jgi:lipoprotein-releasing system ATP-binding protein
MKGASTKSAGILEAVRVWKSYDHAAVEVLRGVDFCACPGETIALCGPSGCGKSTLLHLLGGLDDPDQGEIKVSGHLLVPGRRNIRILRHEIGFVFQLHYLLPDLTLEENCLLSALGAGRSRSAAEQRLAYLSKATGLAHRLKHRIQKLSGGERQRTALCRALMNQPKILLADEPTGALDDRTRGQVFELLMELVATENLTLVMATHDREIASQCQRIAVMKDGRIYE